MRIFRASPRVDHRQRPCREVVEVESEADLPGGDLIRSVMDVRNGSALDESGGGEAGRRM